MKWGSSDIGKVCWGDSEIGKIYHGSDLVYNAGESPIPPSPPYYYGYVTDGLKYMWDGIDKGNNSNGWTDLVNGVFIENHGATSITNGWRVPSGDASSYMGDADTHISAPYDSCTIEIIFKRLQSAGNYTFLFYADAGQINAMCYSTNRFIIDTSPNVYRYSTSLSNNTVYQYSASTARAYRNGTALSYASSSGSPASTNGTWMFSRQSLGSYNNFRGEIYTVRIYSRQLTEAEARANLAVDNERYSLGLTLS